jgi:hypothetical protein
MVKDGSIFGKKNCCPPNRVLLQTRAFPVQASIFAVSIQTEHMSKKRILIAGGAGFIGSHLCDRFMAEGFSVIAMDNLLTGDLTNIEHLLKRRILNITTTMSQNSSTCLGSSTTSSISLLQPARLITCKCLFRL